MKTCLVFLVCALLAPAIATELQSRNDQTVIFNDYVDWLLSQVGSWTKETGLDPMDIPDLFEEISYKPLLITYYGTIHCWNGSLFNMNSASRLGDANMSYDRMMLRLALKGSLDRMEFRYDYQSVFLDLGGWIGYAVGVVSNFVIDFSVIVDTYDNYMYMQNFELMDVGYIDLKLRGNVLTDWMGNLFIKVMTTFFRGTVADMISWRVRDFVQVEIDAMNADRQRTIDWIERMREFGLDIPRE